MTAQRTRQSQAVLESKALSSQAPRWLHQLLHWFSIHQRPMPWRDDPSPYKVWISEIMLQQTRVTAVIPYFENFLQQFPDVHVLANAPQQQVLKAWEGLGYYSRARNLHAAARMIVYERNGCFPKTEAEWHQLPGVGPYTAAAVASIACGQTAAAIDGNVMRVWSRIRGIQEDISAVSWRNKARKDLLRYARKCNASQFNQALMELGALVCLPRNPACGECPLRKICTARKKGWIDRIPYRKKSKPLPHRHEVVLLVEQNGNLLMRQRSDKGLLAGLWEFPAASLPGAATSLTYHARKLAHTLGIPKTVKISKNSRVEHAFTHFTQSLHVYKAELTPSTTIPTGDWHWCSAQTIDNLPLSRSQRHILQQQKGTP